MCHLCLKASPQGKFIPHGQLKLHRRRIQEDLAQLEEASHNQTEELLDDVVSNIFSLTLTNDSRSHPSRLFTSSNEYREAQRLQPTLNTNSAATFSNSFDAIIQSLDHLEQPPLTVPPDQPSTDLPLESRLVTTSTNKLPVDDHKISRSNSQLKRERNILTKKAHASLTQIEKHTTRLLSALDSELPSLEVVSSAEKDLQLLQSTFYGLKRKTETLKKHKAVVGKSLSSLEARLVECRLLHPSATTPLLFNTGELVYIYVYDSCLILYAL